MNTFQYLASTLLALILAYDLYRSRHRLLRGFVILRVTVWLYAIAAICAPLTFVQPFASFLGIARAADLVTYLFALLFIVTTFHFYARCLRLERDITALTRSIAISRASHRLQRPDPSPDIH